MRFTTALSALMLAAVAYAVPAPGPLDVFVPHITSPTQGAIWESKTQQTVTWSTMGAPANISNGAMIMLRKGTVTTPLILAKGFDLRSGSVDITVPYVLADSDYELVLFGDSGNYSPPFTIHSDVPA
ncbi:hypothetical protein DFH06DRAFT_1089681 [Mycena polygramma]|nr:hypothetical protein DFH06DRAFT_1089681 [Mycena polygramma]